MVDEMPMSFDSFTILRDRAVRTLYYNYIIGIIAQDNSATGGK